MSASLTGIAGCGNKRFKSYGALVAAIDRQVCSDWQIIKMKQCKHEEMYVR
jgi:hypothetical protein